MNKLRMHGMAKEHEASANRDATRGEEAAGNQTHRKTGDDVEQKIDDPISLYPLTQGEIIEGIRGQQDRSVHEAGGVGRERARVDEEAGNVGQRPNVRVVLDRMVIVIVKWMVERLEV